MSIKLMPLAAKKIPKFGWLPIDWLLVSWLVIWFWLIWLFGASHWQVVVLTGGVTVSWMIGEIWAKLRSNAARSLKTDNFEISWLISDPSLKWWLIWLGCLSLTTFMSQVWTVSWLQIQWWLVAFSWFWWLGSLKPLPLVKLVVQRALLIGVLSAILGGWLVGSWQPAWINNLASLTYILPSFGHHHIGALIVLLWPFIWAKVSTAKDRRWVAVLMVLIVSLIMSFSRTVLLAVGFQTLIWWWLESPKLSNQKVRFWKLILLGLLLIFALTGVIKFAAGSLSLNPITLKLCYSWWSPPDLCRPSAGEPRLVYWKQALTVWQHFPIFGSGPGTFGLVTRRWFLLGTNQSTFAHQAILQQLAETGLVGLISWGLLISHWLKRFWQASRSQLETLVWRLAVAGGLIIGFFDFDWSQAGFWLPFMTLTVPWLSAELARPKTSLKTQVSIQNWLMRIFQISLIFIFCLMTLASLFGGMWLINPDRFKRLKNWWLVWPMQAEWYAKAISSPEKTETLVEHVSRFAPKHPDLALAVSSAAISPERQYVFLDSLWRLDPVKYWDKNPMMHAAERNDWEQMETVAERMDEFLRENREFWRNTQNENYIEGLIELANYEFETNDYKRGVNALLIAQSLEVWAMHIRPIHFKLFTSISSNQPVADLVELAKVDQSRLGENIGSYLTWYQSLVTQALVELKTDPAYQDWLSDTGQTKPTLKAPKILAWTNKVDQLARVFPILFPKQTDYLAWQVEELAELKIKTEIAKLKFDPVYLKCETNLYLAVQPFLCDGITEWAGRVEVVAEKYLQHYPNELTRPDPESEQIANLVITAGDATVGHKVYKVANYYQLAQKIYPWVMNNRLWWFEILGPIYDYPEVKEFLVFADVWEDFSGDKGGHKPKTWLAFYTKMLEHAAILNDETRKNAYEAKLKIIQANME